MSPIVNSSRLSQSVTDASGSHFRFQGSEPAVSANTTQMVRGPELRIYCRYLPGTWVGTKLDCLVSETDECEQLAPCFLPGCAPGGSRTSDLAITSPNAAVRPVADLKWGRRGRLSSLLRTKCILYQSENFAQKCIIST